MPQPAAAGSGSEQAGTLKSAFERGQLFPEASCYLVDGRCSPALQPGRAWLEHFGCCQPWQPSLRAPAAQVLFLRSCALAGCCHGLSGAGGAG